MWETHAIEELVDIAFKHIDKDWRDHVVRDQRFVRPLETGPLCGNPTKAKEKLGWKYDYSFERLVHTMVDSDLALFS